MKPLKVEEHRIKSFDGTELAYHVVGEGPPVLLAPGLGGSWMAFQHQLAFFADRYRFISWDYRGLYRSGMPASAGAFRVDDHVGDAQAILRAEGVDRCAMVGWSIGVPVLLALFRRAPDLCASLALINGVPGRLWDAMFTVRPVAAVAGPLVRTLSGFPAFASNVTTSAVRSPEVVTWAKRLGLAAPTLDEDLWSKLADSFAGLDMGHYLRVLDRMAEHDAWDVLPELDVPTLIIAGDRDPFTPRRVAERMVRQIAGAELMLVAGGTHYVLLEQPELVNLRLEKFFRERGYDHATENGVTL